MFRDCFRAVGLLLIAILSPVTANAALVGYSFNGTITGMYEAIYLGEQADPRYSFTDLSESSFYPGIKFQVGQAFSGEFHYDSAASDPYISSDGAQASYLDALKFGSVVIGDFLLPNASLPRAGDGSVAIVDNRQEAVDVFQIQQAYTSTDWFVTFLISLQDRSTLALDGLGIPERISLDAFQSAALFQLALLDRTTGNQLQIKGSLGSLNSVNTVAVPEPSSLHLLLAALFLGGLASRLQKRGN